MASSILQNLRKVHAAVVAQQIDNGTSALSAALNEAAIKALLGGFGSPAWNSYMAVFATNPEQLTRLTKRVNDGEEDYLDQDRAYIVSNAICTPETNAFLNDKVNELIDGDPNSPETNPPVSNELNVTAEIKALRPTALREIPNVNV